MSFIRITCAVCECSGGEYATGLVPSASAKLIREDWSLAHGFALCPDCEPKIRAELTEHFEETRREAQAELDREARRAAFKVIEGGAARRRGA